MQTHGTHSAYTSTVHEPFTRQGRARARGVCCHATVYSPAPNNLLIKGFPDEVNYTELGGQSMRLARSTRLGPYEIQDAIEAGGMGEVYRAKDTRLHRVVAIKILPEHLSNSQKFRERFEREARAISALSHPNLCTLHDIGHEDGLDFLVMEYLEGDTLAERLKNGPLPLSQVLRYAIEIAGALAQAHRHGVIHRDLKPANIKLTKTGAKVLDFGIAKIQTAEDTPDATRPTETVTEEGSILGTLQYMAPEQLEGKEADARSDIFAFGVVVHEMATGRHVFEGKSRASVMAAILEREPPALTTLNPLTPALLDRVVKKCLAKDPDERWQTATDLSTGLQWAAENTAASAVESARATPGARLARLSAAVLLAAAVALVLVKLLGPKSPAPLRVVRFSLPPPETTTLLPAAPAVSPDGTLVAFLAATDGRPLVWIRPINSQVTRPLAGTEGAATLFWSPDSHFLAFIAAGKLKKMEISSGSVSTICDASSNTPGAWNPNGTIALTIADRQPLHRVQAVGGVPVPLTALDPTRGDYRHAWPQWLPDSRHFLYIVQTNRDLRGCPRLHSHGPEPGCSFECGRDLRAVSQRFHWSTLVQSR
jgi:serine/threonine protein kinase